MKKHAIIGLLILTWNYMYSNAYYVAPNGNNNDPGTIEKPFATIQKAHDMVQAGDTIFLRGGTYSPSDPILFDRSGTAGSYIVFCSYQGEVPVIDGANIPDGIDTWFFANAGYWKITGPIQVTNGRGAGISISGGRFLEFEQVESSYNGKRAPNGAHGFLLWQGDDILFRNCDAHHNANHLWKEGTDQELMQYQHGDGWRIFSGTNIRLVGCRSWHNLDDNYDILRTESPVEFVDCWAAYAGIDDAEGTITGVPDKNMPRVDGRDLLWGNGIKLGYNEDETKHKVFRCLSWNNNAAGFHMNMGPASIMNSSSYGNRAFGFDFTDGNRHEMYNNWEFDNNTDDHDYPVTLPDLTLSSHNSWDNTLNISISPDDFMGTDDAGMLGQREADGSLPVTPFLRLAEASDLIDAGKDVGHSFAGSAPDIGFSEYGDGSYTSADTPAEFGLDDIHMKCFPNPFSTRIVIQYELPRAERVHIIIYDISGKKVMDLDRGYRSAGTHTLWWNAKDGNGHPMSGGIYLIRIQTDNSVKTTRISYIN